MKIVDRKNIYYRKKCMYFWYLIFIRGFGMSHMSTHPYSTQIKIYWLSLFIRMHIIPPSLTSNNFPIGNPRFPDDYQASSVFWMICLEIYGKLNRKSFNMSFQKLQGSKGLEHEKLQKVSHCKSHLKYELFNVKTFYSMSNLKKNLIL